MERIHPMEYLDTYEYLDMGYEYLNEYRVAFEERYCCYRRSR